MTDESTTTGTETDESTTTGTDNVPHGSRTIGTVEPVRSELDIGLPPAGSGTAAVPPNEHVLPPLPDSIDIVVAVPAFNESERIGEVVRHAGDHADTVLVIDDGSTDDTTGCAEDAGAVVISHPRNRGYGAALKTAFKEAARRDVDHLVTVDGDGQHDLDDIDGLVRLQRAVEAEIVIGNRFDGNARIPLYRRFGLEVINRAVGAALGVLSADFEIRDTQSGFRSYNRDAIRSLAREACLSDGMGASIDVLFHACVRGYDIHELPTRIEYEGDTTSTHDPLYHGAIVIKRIFWGVLP